MKNDEQFERLLDSALHEYRDAEPRPGLDGRILANVAAAGERRSQFAWWRWAWIPVTAMLVLVFAMWMNRPKSISPTVVQNVEPNRAVTPAPVPLNHQAASSIAANGEHDTVRKSVKARRNSALAKAQTIVARSRDAQQFPTAQSTTKQERLLLALVSDSNKPVQFSTPTDTSPISIRPIEIEPLARANEGDK